MEARKYVNTLTTNCIYYTTNVCYVGQSDLTMCFHFNNVRSEICHNLLKHYHSGSKGFGLRAAVTKEGTDEDERECCGNEIFTPLYNVLRYAHRLNKEYVNKSISHYICDETEKHIVRSDFNIIVLYLLVHNNIKLSINTVGSYLHNRLNPIDYLFGEMESVIKSWQIIKS